jgi:hypothetical protein
MKRRKRLLKKNSVACTLAIFALLALETTVLWPVRVEAAITLDPTNPGNFQRDGSQSFTPGPVLRLADQSVGDVIAFFAPDPDAAAGSELDVIATFQIISTQPNNAEVGNRVAINDGTKGAVAACIIKNGVNGIGLLSQGPSSDPNSYLVFVPVDWQAAPVTIRLRRTAAGDAELVEVNGVAPSPRALLSASQLANATRPLPSVEFGAASPEATCTVDYSAFRSERVVIPVAGKLNFTRLRLRDADSVDRIQFRADYTLGNGSDGINPAGEPVTIKLSTPSGGQFYPSPDFNPLSGFDVQGNAPKRRWTLNDGERARTNIERLAFDENPAGSGSVFLRDFRASLADADFSTVNVEITIGTGATADKLTGTANLVQKPAGSGSWRLANEP